MKKMFIALGTAAVIGLGALAPVGSAMAAPASPAIAGAVEASSGLEQVGHRKRRHHKGFHIYIHKPYHGHGYHYGPPCHYKKIKVWSPYHGHYVWKKHKVCGYW